MQLVKKIDIHAHTARVLGPKRRGGTNFALPETLLEMYDLLGVEKGVLLPLTSPECICTISTSEDLKEIAEKKMDQLNAVDIEGAIKIVAGTARSMGVEVVD